MKLHIPKPCHEDWNKMTPETQGRFCSSCEKTVVDFTNWSTTDIQQYFAKHYHTKTCGRFKQEQLTQPVEIAISQQEIFHAPQHRYFLFALLIVFGTTLFSCTDERGNRQPISKIKIVDSAINIPGVHMSNVLLGEPASSVKTPMLIADDGITGLIEPPPDSVIKMGKVAPPIEIDDSSNKKMAVLFQDIMPAFPGGHEELRKFLEQNLIYPEMKDPFNGKVIVAFTVDATGYLKNVVIRKGLAPAYDQAAIDAVSKMPRWIPGMQNGKKTDVQMILPIVFPRRELR
jgi:TonB family protein